MKDWKIISSPATNVIIQHHSFNPDDVMTDYSYLD